MLASSLLPERATDDDKSFIVVGFDLTVPDVYSLPDHDGDGRYVLCGNSRGFVAEREALAGDDVLIFDAQMREIAEDIAQHLHSWYIRRNGSASFFRTDEGCDMFGVIYADVKPPQPPLIGVRVEELPEGR